MSLHVLSLRKRTKVYIDDRYVKMIPGKYKEIFRKKHIKNSIHKRLTQEERFLLEVQIVDNRLKESYKTRYVYNLIKSSVPKMVRKVTTVHGKTYTELVYKNNVAINLGPSDILFQLSINKVSINRNY